MELVQTARAKKAFLHNMDTISCVPKNKKQEVSNATCRFERAAIYNSKAVKKTVEDVLRVSIILFSVLIS